MILIVTNYRNSESSLNAIIMAGGYAKRMWPLTERQPKPLLPVGEKCALDYIVRNLRESGVGRILLSTNLRFRDQFQSWLTESAFEEVIIHAEPSTSEENKLGAVRALRDLAKIIPPDDYLIVAGDNIVTSGLTGMIAFYYSVRSPVVAVYDPIDSKQLEMGSEVILDGDKRIVRFVEKPNHTGIGKLGALLYIFPYRILLKINEYLIEGGNPDEAGYFLEWLHKKETVYGFELGGHIFDIGNPEEFRRATEELSRKS